MRLAAAPWDPALEQDVPGGQIVRVEANQGDRAFARVDHRIRAIGADLDALRIEGQAQQVDGRVEIGDPVVPVVAGKAEFVGPRAAGHAVIAFLARKHIVALAADQLVTPLAPEQRVLTALTGDAVAAALPAQHVVARPP